MYFWDWKRKRKQKNENNMHFQNTCISIKKQPSLIDLFRLSYIYSLQLYKEKRLSYSITKSTYSKEAFPCCQKQIKLNKIEDKTLAKSLSFKYVIGYKVPIKFLHLYSFIIWLLINFPHVKPAFLNKSCIICIPYIRLN